MSTSYQYWYDPNGPTTNTGGATITGVTTGGGANLTLAPQTTTCPRCDRKIAMTRLLYVNPDNSPVALFHGCTECLGDALRHAIDARYGNHLLENAARYVQLAYESGDWDVIDKTREDSEGLLGRVRRHLGKPEGWDPTKHE